MGYRNREGRYLTVNNISCLLSEQSYMDQKGMFQGELLFGRNTINTGDSTHAYDKY